MTNQLTLQGTSTPPSKVGPALAMAGFIFSLAVFLVTLIASIKILRSPKL